MLSLFKSDPKKKLQKQYAKKLEEAMQAQRNGKIELYGRLTQEAENISKQIDNLKQQ